MGLAVSKISQPTDQELTNLRPADPAAQHEEERVSVSAPALAHLMDHFDILDAFVADLATQHEENGRVSVSAVDNLIAHVHKHQSICYVIINIIKNTLFKGDLSFLFIWQ